MVKLSGRRTAGAAATTLAACSLFAAAALPAAAMTVTFVRHGESFGNANNSIDTSVPGPNLTPVGVAQAGIVADKLQSPEFVAKYGAIDAIYASTMVRTQQTAKPLADDLGMTPVIIGYPKNGDAGERIGVREISAGIFEGLPEKDGLGRIGYIIAPLAWTLGLQFVSVPGGENGLEFNERMTNALKQIEEDTPTGPDGQQNAAVFSHGATIMFWTMMNVDNPNLLLVVQHPLSNTDVVVVESNGEGGWTLKSWAGQDVPEADYPTKMFVNVRDLIVAPQQAIYNMRKPLLTPDPQAIVTTGVQGIKDVGEATVKFVKDSVTDTLDAITSIPGSLTQPTSQVVKLNTKTSTVDSGTPAVVNTVEDAEPAVTRATAGTTRLTTGNKVEPGKAISAARDRASRATDGVRSGIESSVKQAGETVKKLTRADKNDSNTGKAKAAKDAA